MSSGKLSLESVTLSGFRSFKEQATIHFGDGATLVRGKHANSDVGSGSGKSSVMMAVAWALSLGTPPSTVLKNWDSKQMSVDVSLVLNDTPIVVHRSLKNKQLHIGADSWHGPEVDPKLRELLGFDKAIAEALCYRPQGSEGTFLNASDNDRKEFLSKLLGISFIEQGLEQANSELSDLKNRQKAINEALMVAEGFLASSQSVQEEFVSAMKAAREAKAAFDAAMVTGGNVDVLRVEAQSQQSEIRKRQELQFKVKQAREQTSLMQQANVRLKKEIEKLESNSCPTCHQDWVDDGCETLLEQKREEIAGYIQKIATNVAFEKHSVAVLAEIPKFEARYQELISTIATAEGPKRETKAVLESAAARVKRANAAKLQMESGMTKVETLKAESRTLETKVATLEHVKTLLGGQGFLSVVFDEVLEQVQNKTNDMLVRVPNVSSFTVSLSSSSTLKNGTTKSAISVKLFKADNEVDPTCLSGGQRCALDLCLDLAVREVVRQRLGSLVGWICLDEAMDGLGAVEKQEMLDIVFSEVSGQVIVIDHDVQVQEGFATTVDISFDGSTSVVLQSY